MRLTIAAHSWQALGISSRNLVDAARPPYGATDCEAALFDENGDLL
jgi:hypothetical protein